MYEENEDVKEIVDTQENIAEKYKNKRTRKQSVQWTKEDAKRLVLAVKTEQCLWDHTATVYKDREKRELAWANIAGIIGQPVKECTYKWNNLRVNYRTTILKMNATKSGQEAVANNTLADPYNAMKFLGRILNLVPKQRVDTWVNEASMSSLSVSSVARSDTESDTVSQPNSATEAIDVIANDLMTTRRRLHPKTAKPTSVSRREALLQNAENAMNQIQQRDEWDCFGEFVATNARSWEHDLAAQFKLEMMSLILKFATSDHEEKQNKRNTIIRRFRQ